MVLGCGWVFGVDGFLDFGFEVGLVDGLCVYGLVWVGLVLG